MKVAERVVFNTIILYARVIATMLITLVSVPLVLKALGASDYGIYNLVAGVIAMLTFLNASMNVATQRYLSVALGTKDITRLNTVFNVSILLHLLIGIIVAVLFEICGFFLFDGFLNIDAERISAAKIVYQALIVSSFSSIISVPYNALINAKEDMWVLSMNYLIKDVAKLLLAFYLSYSSTDRLILYGIGMAVISISVVLISRYIVRRKYKEISFNLRVYFNKDVFREMFGFAGWNTFGSLATIGRNQGISVVFNLFYGTIINAAYGVANQVSGALSAMTTSLTQSINPQLMQSKGMGDNKRLVRISIISSKYSFTLFSIFAVPLIIEMPKVLRIWLGDPPEYTLVMSQLVIILSMVHIYSNGLMSSIQATGKIAAYQVTMSILILINIPISFYLLKVGCSPYSCLVCFIVLEIISLIIRMLFAQKLAGVNSVVFTKSVLLPTMICIIVAVIAPVTLHFIMQESFVRIVVVTIAYLVIYIPMVWFLVVEKEEQPLFIGMFRKLAVRKKN